MRLFLSSWHLRPEHRPAFLRPAVGGGRAGIILNALDEYHATRDRDLPRETRTLTDLGYRCEELDLRQYFDSPNDLVERLRQLDLVWAIGGNSFVLARAMAQSQFITVVRDRLGDPEFMYGGYSAGSCVAGPDLDGIHLVDDPEVMPSGYSAEVEAACLKLVPFRIVPHWRSDHPESDRVEHAAAHLSEIGLSHRCLRDGQAFAVDGETVSLLDLDEPDLAAPK